MSRLRICLAIAGVTLLAPPIAALMIDDFEVGDFVATNTGGLATFEEQSGLPNSSVRGGVRLVRVSASGTSTAATASLTTTMADDSVALTVAGPTSSFQFIYDAIADGAANTTGGNLGLDLSPFSSIDVAVGGTAAAVTAQLSLYSSLTTQHSPTLPVTPGTLSFDLSGFTLNLSDIQALRLQLFNVATLDLVTLDSIQAVPEPGTAGLLAAGLAAVAAHRRGSRSSRKA